MVISLMKKFYEKGFYLIHILKIDIDEKFTFTFVCCCFFYFEL